MSTLEQILSAREGSSPGEPGGLWPLEKLEELEEEMSERYGLPRGTVRLLSRDRAQVPFDLWASAFNEWMRLSRRVARPAIFKRDPGVSVPELPERFVKEMLRELDTIAGAIDAVSTATCAPQSPVVQALPEPELEPLRRRANAARGALGRVRLYVLAGGRARSAHGTEGRVTVLAAAEALHAQIKAAGGPGYGRAVARVCALWAAELGIEVPESTIRKHLS